MGLRFRRSVTLIPGVRLNIGKRGGSIRVGGRGFGYTAGTSGTTVTAGVPGTGLFYSKKISAPQAQAKAGIWAAAIGFGLAFLMLLGSFL